MHRDDPPPVVTAVRPDVPAGLASIVTASLAKDPAARPADGEALLRALQGGDETATIVTAPATAPAAAAATQVLRPAPARQRDWPIVPDRSGRRAAPRGRRRARDRPHEQRLERQLAAGRADAAERPGLPVDDRAPPRRLRPPPRRRRPPAATTTTVPRHHNGSDHDSAADDDEPTDHHDASCHHDRTDHDGAARPRPPAATTTDTTPVTTAEGTTTTAAPVRVLYFGTYDRAHPRNVNAIAALRLAGAEIEERQVPIRRGGLVGALNVFAAEWRLLAPRAARLRRGDRRVPRSLRRPARAAPREEAPARVRRRPVARERARRRAPPFSRPVDGGDRPARGRLPRVSPA